MIYLFIQGPLTQTFQQKTRNHLQLLKLQQNIKNSCNKMLRLCRLVFVTRIYSWLSIQTYSLQYMIRRDLTYKVTTQSLK